MLGLSLHRRTGQQPGKFVIADLGLRHQDAATKVLHQVGSNRAEPPPRQRSVRSLAAHHEGIFAPGHVLVLLSDGVGGPLRDGPSTVAVGLAQALVVPPSPLDLARLVDFARQGCHDDRTLLAVWPASYRGTPQILD